MDVRVLKKNQRYINASAELRSIGADPDLWPTPPAGLFVVKERMVYMRLVSDMSLVHEFAHAVDAALGDGEYISYREPRVRNAFLRATSFVTPYSEVGGIDEWFAEGLRAFCEANDLGCPWPSVSKARLKECSPDLYEYIDSVFCELSLLHTAA